MPSLKARDLQAGRPLAFYALTSAAFRPAIARLIARSGPGKITAAATCMLIGSMLLLYRWLTNSTPDSYFLLPLVLHAYCLNMLLPSLGSGTVARLDQHYLLDGVSLHMTFRKLGASLGVAFLTILLENRGTLHSARAPLADLVPTAQIFHDWAAPRRLHNFFDSASWSMTLSSVRSATTRFSRTFSS